MATDEYLKHGLIAMSKCMENGFWLHGHVGAEILTNTFFILEFDPDDDLKAAIQDRINRLIVSKPSYFDDHLLVSQHHATKDAIEKELAKCTSNLSTAGHGVIFGTLTLKAVRKLDGWLPLAVNEGIIKLLVNTQSDDPNRYYGQEDYQNAKIDLSAIPDFQTPDVAARYTLAHQDYFKSQEVDGKFYHFQGNQLHDITHANALVMLEEMGYAEMATKGIQSLRKQIKLGQLSPPHDHKYESKAVFSPMDPSFWLRDVQDEHHFKLAYSVVHLLRRHEDLEQTDIFKQLSGHWELMP